jgi:hypothetical protein
MSEETKKSPETLMVDILLQNAQYLRKWNEQNIDIHPEQVRKNTETLVTVYRLVFEVTGML